MNRGILKRTTPSPRLDDNDKEKSRWTDSDRDKNNHFSNGEQGDSSDKDESIRHHSLLGNQYCDSNAFSASNKDYSCGPGCPSTDCPGSFSGDKHNDNDESGKLHSEMEPNSGDNNDDEESNGKNGGGSSDDGEICRNVVYFHDTTDGCHANTATHHYLDRASLPGLSDHNHDGDKGSWPEGSHDDEQAASLWADYREKNHDVGPHSINSLGQSLCGQDSLSKDAQSMNSLVMKLCVMDFLDMNSLGLKCCGKDTLGNDPHNMNSLRKDIRDKAFRSSAPPKMIVTGPEETRGTFRHNRCVRLNIHTFDY